MNLIKRLTTSVTASIENAVGELENHDAIIEANIKKTKQSVAKTKARLIVLQQQQDTFEKQHTKAIEQIAVWEKRAASLSNSDEEKALQCLVRRNQHEHDLHRLGVSIEKQNTLINNVNTNLNTLTSSLDEMVQRHNLMRSRQTVADINHLNTSFDDSQKLDDTFERWEATVIEKELSTGCNVLNDPLEAQFLSKENTLKLQDQLSELHNNKTEQST